MLRPVVPAFLVCGCLRIIWNRGFNPTLDPSPSHSCRTEVLTEEDQQKYLNKAYCLNPIMAQNKPSTILVTWIFFVEGGMLCSSYHCSCCAKRMSDENHVSTWALGNLLQVSEKNVHLCLSFSKENFISGNMGA
jgi:hypothetical protein